MRFKDLYKENKFLLKNLTEGLNNWRIYYMFLDRKLDVSFL